MTTARILLTALLALTAAGCADYRIRFHVADVINTDLTRPTEDVTRQPLEINIVCLTEDDLDRYPQLVEGAVTSADWFRGRAANPPQPPIPSDQVYTLRAGPPDGRARLAGPALTSGRDLPPFRARTFTVPIRHPQAFDLDSAIVIFARFREAGYDARIRPLVITPAPHPYKTIDVHVDRDHLVWTNAPETTYAK